MSQTQFSLTKASRYRDRPLDGPSDEFCPCKECHPEPRRLRIVEVGYGCCVSCVNAHGQIDVTPTPEEFATRDRRMLDDAGVPHGFRRMTFESWKGRLPDGIDRWPDGERWSVLLYGPTGTGKTHLAVAILQRCLRIGRVGVSFFVVSELVRQLKEEFDTGTKLLDTRLRAAKLLVLDDVFAERETEWSRSTILDLLHFRHADSGSTILTTNLTPGEIGKIDARTASRLQAGYQIQTTSRDFRARGAV